MVVQRNEEEPCAFAKLWGQLDGKPFHCYMLSLPTILGRGSTATEGSRKPAGFIDLGKSKALSREHATITWVPRTRTYHITCLSKNGMVVNGKYKAKGGVEALKSRTPIKLGPALMYFLLPEKRSNGRNDSRGAGAASTSNANEQMKAPSASRPQSQSQKTPSNAAPNAAATAATSPAVAAPTATVAATAQRSRGGVSFQEMVNGAFKSQALAGIAGAGGLSSGDVQNWVMQNYPEWNEEGSKMRSLAVGIEGVLAKDYVSSGPDRWTETSLPPIAKRAKTSAVARPSTATATATAQPMVVVSSLAPAVPEAGNGGEEDGGGIDVGMDD